MSFPEQLRKLRLERGLSQQKLANKSGLSQASIYQWEKGTRKPKAEQLKKLADALDVSLSELFDTVRFDLFIQQTERLAKEFGIELNDDNDDMFNTCELNEDYIISKLKQLNIEGQIRLLNHIEDLLLIKKYTEPDQD